MKNYIIRFVSAVLWIMAGLAPLSAQHCLRHGVGGAYERKELLEDRREFIQKELGLTNQESEDVAAILNKWDVERAALWEKVLEQRKALKKKQKLTQSEVMEYYALMQKTREQDAALSYKTEVALAQLLSPEKLLKLDDARKDFMRNFLAKRRKSYISCPILNCPTF